MRPATTLAVIVVAMLASAGSAQEKESKHPALNGLSDIGPTAKRQAGYMLDEVSQLFNRVDKVMTSDNTTKTHMENAYRRATQRSIDNWNERRQKLYDAYQSWARQKGRPKANMPEDWKAYFNRLQSFLGDMADGRGYRAAAWRRELNTAHKRFRRYAKRVPQAIKLYLGDVAEADGELSAAQATLDQAVAGLDDLKRHRRHLRKIRTLIKNLQRHLVDQQKQGQEIMDDKTLFPRTFQKTFEFIREWRDECDADADLPATCKSVPKYWFEYGDKASDDYEKFYDTVEDGAAAFLDGTIFEASDHFSGVEYGSMVGVVDDLLAQVEARIDKIQGR